MQKIKNVINEVILPRFVNIQLILLSFSILYIHRKWQNSSEPYVLSHTNASKINQ